MTKFFRKHDYNVSTNIKEYNDVESKRARATFKDDVQPQLDDFLARAQATNKKSKAKLHFFIYYSGIVVQTADTEEYCGVDSLGGLIPLDRYCEAFATFKIVFTVCYIEGVSIKEPKRGSGEFTAKYNDSLLMSILPMPSFGATASTKSTGEKTQTKNGKELSKHKKGISRLYLTLEYQEIASTIPHFILSRMTHRLIAFVNSAGISGGSESLDDKGKYTSLTDGSFVRPQLDLEELHVIFRENYQNTGITLADKDWKIWRIFNEPNIERIPFDETQRKYIG